MAERLLELYISEDARDGAQHVIEAHPVKSHWVVELPGSMLLYKLLISSGKSEALLDHLEKQFGHMDNFRVILLSVKGSLPADAADKIEDSSGRLSRTELYASVTKQLNSSPVYFSMVILSAIPRWHWHWGRR